MRMHVSTDISLSEPNVDFGFITWLSIEVIDDGPDGTESKRIGRAQVARIHLGNAADNAESILDALDADSGDLIALCGIYVDDGWVNDNFTDSVASDLLYVRKIEIDPAYTGRNVDLAVVRRLGDTLGQGAALIVIPYKAPQQIERWEKLGFEVTTPGASEGYLHLDLAWRTARIDDPDKPGHFRILPNPSPLETETHH